MAFLISKLKLATLDRGVKIVKQAKYLGLQIDCSLDWKEHIKAVSAKVSRAVGLLRFSRAFLPKDTLQTLYTGIVEPHLRYCCSVWGCARSTEIHLLQKLQKRAVGIITKISFDAPSRPFFEGLGWKTIDELVTFESKTVVFKPRSSSAIPVRIVCAKLEIFVFVQSSQLKNRPQFT